MPLTPTNPTANSASHGVGPSREPRRHAGARRRRANARPRASWFITLRRQLLLATLIPKNERFLGHSAKNQALLAKNLRAFERLGGSWQDLTTRGFTAVEIALAYGESPGRQARKLPQKLRDAAQQTFCKAFNEFSLGKGPFDKGVLLAGAHYLWSPLGLTPKALHEGLQIPYLNIPPSRFADNQAILLGTLQEALAAEEPLAAFAGSFSRLLCKLSVTKVPQSGEPTTTTVEPRIANGNPNAHREFIAALFEETPGPKFDAAIFAQAFNPQDFTKKAFNDFLETSTAGSPARATILTLLDPGSINLVNTWMQSFCLNNNIAPQQASLHYEITIADAKPTIQVCYSQSFTSDPQNRWLDVEIEYTIDVNSQTGEITAASYAFKPAGAPPATEQSLVEAWAALLKQVAPPPRFVLSELPLDGSNQGAAVAAAPLAKPRQHQRRRRQSHGGSRPLQRRAGQHRQPGHTLPHAH